jgi:DNA-binding transcriptional MocR family regulator
MLWAFDDAPASLSSPERFVLLAIADHVDDATGDAWPSIARIARRTGLSRTSVKAAVRILSELGVIDVVDQGAPVARAETRPNLYRWHPDQLRLGLDVRTRRVGGRSRRVVEPVDGPAQPGDKEGVASRPGSPADREGVASRPGGGRQPTPNPHRTLREQADTGSHTPSPPQLAAACGRSVQHRPHTTTDGLCEGMT